MRQQPNSEAANSAVSLDEIFTRDPNNPSILVVDGYGVTINVRAGRLAIADGIGRHRRQRTLSRSQRTVKRIVVLAQGGAITLDAFRWCNDVGIALLAIDPEVAELLTYSAPNQHDDAKLRRAQALTADTPTALELAKYLVDAKLHGQAQVAARQLSNPEAASTIQNLIPTIESAGTTHQCLLVEARAALTYFAAWSDLSMRFATADQPRLPDAWRTFQQRSSELTGWSSPRSATHPTNAILNYCYRLAEVESTLACRTLGLDPGLGVLHVDKAYRRSLALDLIEPIRPDIDAYVIDLIGSHTFRKADFHETRDGRCRVLAPLTHVLTESMPQWAHAVAPYAEKVAHTLAAETGSRRRTPLTGKQRTSARRPAQPPAISKPAPTCTGCGGPLGDRRRTVCPSCFDSNKLALTRERYLQAQARLSELQQRAMDPVTKPDTATLRSAKASANRSACDLWDLQNPDAQRDPEHFRQNILSSIEALPIKVIAEHLDIAQDAAWKIRDGRLTPHPRHWETLANLGAAR